MFSQLVAVVRSRMLPRLLLLVAAATAAGSPALAQSADLAGKPVREIVFEGRETLADDSVLFYLGLEVGKPYDPGVLDRKLLEFWSRELVDDILIEAEALGDGVKLRVRLTERPELVSLDYQGNKKVNRTDIGDRLDKEHIEVYEGLPLSLGELRRLKHAVEQLYAERGYRFAQVETDQEEVSKGAVRVMITIDEGNKVKIKKIVFEGNDLFEGGRLRRQMKKTKETGLIARLRKRDVYNPATMKEDLDNIAKLYRNYGYKDVVLGEPEVEVVSKGGGDPDRPAAKRQLSLVIPIEEGPRWKLGQIEFEGNTVFKDELLRSVFEEPKGGWLRQETIDEGVEKVGEFYRNTGYIFAQVDPEVREQPEQVADVVVKVEENDQFKVRRIEFAGNDRTQDRVLRRELRVQEGMVFNAGALKNSLFKIQQLEYWKLNEDDPVEFDYDIDSKSIDLTVKGQEAERTELQFGGGYSELDGLFAQASVATRNFLGRGETLSVAFQTSKYREMIDLSYFVPWLRDRPQSLGVQVFKRDIDFDLFVDQRYLRNEQGGVLTYGRSLGLFHSVSLSYANSDFEDFRSQNFDLDGDPATPPTAIEQGFAFRRSSLTANYSYDSHDSRLEPNRGFRVRASLEYAGGPLGGEDYFIEPTLNIAYTRPLISGKNRRGVRTIGRVNLNFSYINPFGTDDDGQPRELFFLNRYFLGGENSIRGYGYRSIWVRDPETGETVFDETGVFPQGGDKYFYLNLEHHIVLGGPLRLVLFADGGNVYSESQDIDFSHLRATAGLELRINVPLFGAPLRFIYARNLDPLDNLTGLDQERFDSFDFSIGTSF